MCIYTYIHGYIAKPRFAFEVLLSFHVQFCNKTLAEVWVKPSRRSRLCSKTCDIDIVWSLEMSWVYLIHFQKMIPSRDTGGSLRHAYDTMCIYICMYVCMYVCMYILRMYMTFVCDTSLIYVVCIYVVWLICIYIYIYIYTRIHVICWYMLYNCKCMHACMRCIFDCLDRY